MKTFEELKELAREHKSGLEASAIKTIDAVEDMFYNYDVDINDFLQLFDTFYEEDYIDWLERNVRIDIDVDLYNEFIDDNGYTAYMFEMKEFDTVMQKHTPTEIAEMISDGQFDIYDGHFFIDPDGYLVSVRIAKQSLKEILSAYLGYDNYNIWFIEKYYPELVEPTTLHIVEKLFE